MKIVADIDIPYIKGVLEPYAEVAYLKGGAISRADVADADALVVRTRTKCGRRLLEGTRVKMIATATVGFDHIDMEYCAAAGITVATSAGSNARAVLQWVGAALVYASAGQGWRPGEKTLGVVGVGNVGSPVAAYARQWGFGVLCCDPPRQRRGEKAPGGDDFVDFGRITRDCDIITFHVPLIIGGSDATFHMAARGFFDGVKEGALIINASRGEVVDNSALSDAVGRGRCSAIIDTWEREPDIDGRLLEAAVLGTPHIAGYSAQGKANASAMAVRAVARRFGLPLTDWYPYAEVAQVAPADISWERLTETIAARYDIGADSSALKRSPGAFETLRNRYRYRAEYF